MIKPLYHFNVQITDETADAKQIIHALTVLRESIENLSYNNVIDKIDTMTLSDDKTYIAVLTKVKPK